VRGGDGKGGGPGENGEHEVAAPEDGLPQLPRLLQLLGQLPPPLHRLPLQPRLISNLLNELFNYLFIYSII
jgi:hypothetical protein